MMKPLPLLAATLAIAACSAPSEPERNDVNAATEAVPTNAVEPASPVATADAEQLTIILQGDGLLAEEPGHGARLGFDVTTSSQAERALAALGSPKRSTSSSECPTGQLDYLDYPNGLQLAFQNGKLVGWWAAENAKGVATADGIRPGSSRQALGDAPVQDVSFGKLFTIEEVNGLLDERTATRVTTLWAGLACIFD